MIRAVTLAADPRAVAESVARELHVQDRLPTERQFSRGETNTQQAAPNEPHGGPQVGGGSWGGAGAASGVFGWIALGFIAICALVWLLDAVDFGGRRRTRAAVADARETGAAAAGGTAPVIRTSAERLAAEGRYTEAIHQLLAEALALLRRRAGGEIPDALTSREIVRTIALPSAERDALRDMVVCVERTWFAKRLAVLDDYRAVRASFDVFARPASPRG